MASSLKATGNNLSKKVPFLQVWLSNPTAKVSDRFLLLRQVIGIAVAAVVLISASQGQATPGVTPFSVYQASEYDSISLSTLNVMLGAPIISKKGLVPLSLSFGGNSSIGKTGFGSGTLSSNAHFGDMSILTGTVSWRTIADSCTNGTTTTIYNGFGFADSSGASHSFAITVDDHQCLYPSTATVTSNDGSGYTMTVRVLGQPGQQGGID